MHEPMNQTANSNYRGSLKAKPSGITRRFLQDYPMVSFQGAKKNSALVFIWIELDKIADQKGEAVFSVRPLDFSRAKKKKD